jgi:hypothetical protein
MPGTGAEIDPGSIRWNPEMTFYIECMDMSDQTTQYSISTYCVLYSSLLKCLWIEKMPGTGAKNVPGSIRWEPEMFCHIECIDISNETTPNLISFSSMLYTSLLKCS